MTVWEYVVMGLRYYESMTAWSMMAWEYNGKGVGWYGSLTVWEYYSMGVKV